MNTDHIATMNKINKGPLALLFLVVFAVVAPAQSQRTVSLPRSTPEQQGVASAEVLAFVDAADKNIDTMNSFMLVRHGHVVAEGWWSPYDRDTPHTLYSLSKSFTSTAIGLAISEGKLSLDDDVLKFFPEDAPANPSINLRAMRVRDLLRMSAGNQLEAPIRPLDPMNTSWTKTFLEHPVPFKPGTHFVYNSPATFMLSAIVQKVTGMTVFDYLRPRLFDPLGFKEPKWDLNPQGITVGAYGLSVRTEEIARFGQLYLQRGKWNGKQLIPETWVEQATSMQTGNGSSPASDWDQGYGYQFWRSRHNSFRGDGAFGQYCLVLPELDAVIAITSGVRDMQKVMNLVWDKLLPAIKAGRMPENRASREKLEARLSGLEIKVVTGSASSSQASKVSGKWFEFVHNDRGVMAMSLDFSSPSPVLIVRTARGEMRTEIGMGKWVKGRASFTNGIDRFLSMRPDPLTAASGAWTSEDTFSVKILLYETPYYSTLNFKFDEDRIVFDSEYNVSFGPTKPPQLIGQLSP